MRVGVELHVFLTKVVAGGEWSASCCSNKCNAFLIFFLNLPHDHRSCLLLDVLYTVSDVLYTVLDVLYTVLDQHKNFPVDLPVVNG